MSYTGGDRSEFGIIENIDPTKDYSGSYEPEKYQCTAICEEAIDDWWNELTDMKSYYHCMDRPETNIARFGVTLIPPESLELLINVMRTKTRPDFMGDSLEIVDLLLTAKKRNKYVILYDV